MTYHNAIKLLQQLPSEHQISPISLSTLWEALGFPQRNLKYLRLTGGSEKTVCAEMLLSVYQNSEYCVGALSLPLRGDGRDNILINSCPLDPDEFTSHMTHIIQTVKQFQLAETESLSKGNNTPTLNKISLSQSEFLLTIALLAFRKHHCSFCLIESEPSPYDPSRRLPAPFAAAICGTIPSENSKEIQQIRSYICHGIQEIVSAPQNQGAYRIISETCASVNCRLSIPSKTELTIHRLSLGGSEFSYKSMEYRLGLCGKFQVVNATVALEMIDMLARRGYTLSHEKIKQGFLQIKIPAKLEILSVSPTIIVDSSHSESAIDATCESLFDFQKILGRKLRLCLPVGELTEQYLNSFARYNYSIEALFAYDENVDTPKSITQKILNELAKDETLFILGTYESTIKIRQQILRQLSK